MRRRKQQIAEFLLGIASGVELFAHLAVFFADFIERQARIVPVEADLMRLVLHLAGAHKRGQAGRHVAHRFRRAPQSLFLFLNLLPALNHILGRRAGAVAENVPVPVNHLPADGRRHVGDCELRVLLRDARMEHHLQHHVAQLVGDAVRVALVDGRDDLVRLFEHVLPQRFMRLLRVPRAAVAPPAQPRHNIQQIAERIARARGKQACGQKNAG